MTKHRDIFNRKRNCEQVDPGRFEKGVEAALTRHHAAHSANGPGVVTEAFSPIFVEGVGTIRLNESLPENQMMAGFLEVFAPKDVRESAAGVTRMLGLYMFIQDHAGSGNPSKEFFGRNEAGKVDTINPDLFTAAALAPVKIAGKFKTEDLLQLVRLQGQTRDKGLSSSPES